MDTDVQQMVLVKKEAPEDHSVGVDQQDPEHLHIKDEQKELWTSLEGEQLHLKEETDTARFLFTTGSIKSENDEENLIFSQLQQMEDRDFPTSCSADHLTSGTSGGAKPSRKPDLNHHEQTSNSLEIEDGGDEEENDDVNLDSELSDAGPKTGNGDKNDWNKSRPSESDVKIVIKSFSCSECGKEFLHKWSFQKHVRVTGHSTIRSSGCLVNKNCVQVKQHVDSCRKFSCDDCGKIFIHKTNLNTHMRVHTGQKPFACELCGQKFSHKTSLNEHMRVHTGQKPFACELCGQRFSQKTHLNNHIRIHTGQKPFACDFCGQKFSQKTHLNNHIRIHTGQKPFACELCEQRFCRKSNLCSHMRVHTGQKPFVCELCGQKFSQKTHLNNHISIHTGQKPFVCELCGQRFSLKTNLNRHMKVHTGPKPFACD